MKNKYSFFFFFYYLCLSSLSLCAKDLFVVITPEKTGTHLLTKALTLMTGMEVENHWDHDYELKEFHYFLNCCEKNKTYCQAHLFPNADIIEGLHKRRYKIIFLMRDPRDQLLSTLFYIRDRGWTYGPLAMHEPFGRLSFAEQIDEMITGKKFKICIPKGIIGRRLPWMELETPPVYTAYYENLVGVEGGGSKEAQIEELTQLANFLNLKLSKRIIAAVADSIYGSPGEATFNIGKIGTWRLYFDDIHKQHFKKVFGTQLIDLGYESDMDW